MLAGKLKPIAGDPDGAIFQEDQGDLTNATLHYVRQGYQVETRVFVGPKQKDYETIRQKLVKLKRLPF